MTKARTASEAVADRVRTFRLRRGWSVRQLAEQCAKQGFPSLTQASLTNLERGAADPDGSRRGGRPATVDELLALARVLKVAPALLLFPIGEQGEVQVTSPWSIPTWEAFRWFAGEAYPPGDAEEHWAVPVYLWRRHDHWVSEWTSAKVDGDQRSQDRAVLELRNLRAEMHRSSLTPPVLPADMAFVDERQHAYLTPIQAEGAIMRGETVRLVDDSRPAQGKTMKAGAPTRLGAALEHSRNLAEEVPARDSP